MADIPPGYDQLRSMNPPGKRLTSEEYQDESIEHLVQLVALDSYRDTTGIDNKGNKKKLVRNPFKSKTPPDHRQEIHKGDGTKGNKKESRSGLKSYPATKELESSTSGTAELKLARKLSKERQA